MRISFEYFPACCTKRPPNLSLPLYMVEEMERIIYEYSGIKAD
jgi:hypothetical protein